MSLLDSAKEWVLTNLPIDKSDVDLDKYLQGLDAHQLLVIYHNWMSRLVKPQIRNVYTSPEFDANPLRTTLKVDVDHILADIEKGADLKKYLSRGLKSVVQVPGRKKLARRTDLDLMLIAQDIHHLHVSTNVEADGYVTRSGPLIFAIFKQNDAYLIDIKSHGDWTRDDVLIILNREWPDANLVHEVKGGPQMEVRGLAVKYSEEERGNLQKNGVNAAIETNGKVLMPTGLMSTAGYSFHSVRAADALVEDIERVQTFFIDNDYPLKLLFANDGKTRPDNPSYKFAIMMDGPGMIEEKSATWIPFSALPLR